VARARPLDVRRRPRPSPFDAVAPLVRRLAGVELLRATLHRVVEEERDVVVKLALVTIVADAAVAALFDDPLRYLALAPDGVSGHGRAFEAERIQELRDRGRARQGPTLVPERPGAARRRDAPGDLVRLLVDLELPEAGAAQRPALRVAARNTVREVEELAEPVFVRETELLDPAP
jgi:hypothetical protein